MLFRGYLLRTLTASRLGNSGAAVLSSALWTALHYGYSAISLVEVFLMGLLLTALVRRTGSIRVGLLCHAVYNSTLLIGLRSWPLP